MAPTLAFNLFVLFLLPALPFLFREDLRARAFLLYPPMVALQFAMVAFLSGAAHAWLSYEAGPAFTLYLVASVLVWCLALGAPRYVRATKGWERPSLLLWILVTAIVVLADSYLIGARQGWHLEGAASPPGYFRIPFNEDVMRNVAIVNGLIRGTESPLIPGFANTYQLFWFHFAARAVALFHAQSAYPLVMGCALATATVFFFLLFWTFAVLRPGWWFRYWWVGLVLVVLTSHADVVNGIWSWLATGRWGIEADWSIGHVNFFRYISPKFFSLIAPQHTLFFIFFLPYLVIFLEKKVGKLSRLFPLEGLFFVCCFLASPIMTYVVFPLVWVGEALARPGRLRGLARLVPKILGFTFIGFAAFRAAMGFAPTDLFLRTGSTTFSWMPSLPDAWKLAPLLPLQVSGFAGVLVVILALLRLRSSFPGRPRFPYLFAMLFGLVFFNFFFTSPELRRHFSMIAAVLSFIYVVRALPSYSQFVRVPAFVWGLGILSLSTLVMHGYYVYSFTAKPNVLARDIPWRDYFAINRILKEHYPYLQTVAAVSSEQGIAKPIIMEVTTSFAQSVDSYTHARVSQRTFSVLRKIERAGCPLPYARDLGYRAFVWGPIEDRVWGERAAKRFKSPERLLAKAGNVELYLWGDEIRGQHAALGLPAGERSDNAYGDALQNAGWNLEAIDAYLGIIRERPNSWRAHEGMAKSLDAIGMKQAAQTHQQRAEGYRRAEVLTP